MEVRVKQLEERVAELEKQVQPERIAAISLQIAIRAMRSKDNRQQITKEGIDKTIGDLILGNTFQ